MNLQDGVSKPIQLVDLPGHPTLRRKFDEYIDKARGIIFLVDGVDFLPNKTETAE